ncbi:hypothetical protein B0T17DRAFT_510803 [Bombardia bombarda]|uniref:Uncharacterized protein n=1 Tax=Bombardia bombarda TaxID=252184 RepID=A0AA39WGL4_9PEZI|nr:hypothetical protein B0T17DRAFT_510803 [Bombardia bombarda]
MTLQFKALGRKPQRIAGWGFPDPRPGKQQVPDLVRIFEYRYWERLMQAQHAACSPPAGAHFGAQFCRAVSWSRYICTSRNKAWYSHMDNFGQAEGSEEEVVGNVYWMSRCGDCKVADGETSGAQVGWLHSSLLHSMDCGDDEQQCAPGSSDLTVQCACWMLEARALGPFLGNLGKMEV